MSKLTVEQKALNKAATKLRNAAYQQRMAAYMTESDAARLQVEQSPVTAKALNASRMFENELAKRDAALSVIERQISALQDQYKAVQQRHMEVIRASKEQQSKAWDEKQKLERELEKAVDLKYSDMASYPTPAMWKSISEFMEQAESGKLK